MILTPAAKSFRPEHTNSPGGLEKYFQDNVIGGPGAFTVVAESHESFGRALTKKLIQEIAGLRRPPARRRELSLSVGRPARFARRADPGKRARTSVGPTHVSALPASGRRRFPLRVRAIEVAGIACDTGEGCEDKDFVERHGCCDRYL